MTTACQYLGQLSRTFAFSAIVRSTFCLLAWPLWQKNAVDGSSLVAPLSRFVVIFQNQKKTFCSLNCSSLMVFAVIDQVFHPEYFSAVTLSQTASIRISKVPCFHFSQALALFRPLNLSTCWLSQQSEFCLHRHNSCYSVSLL